MFQLKALPMSRDEPPEQPSGPPGTGAKQNDPPGQARRWRASELLDGAREAVIEHGPDVYRLRLTANNKLILTK